MIRAEYVMYVIKYSTSKIQKCSVIKKKCTIFLSKILKYSLLNIIII